MVVCRLGENGHSGHERERLDEIRERVRPREGFIIQAPCRVRGEKLGSFHRCEQIHGHDSTRLAAQSCLHGCMTLNVLGTELQPCSLDPLTGYYRNGRCDTGSGDVGVHAVCARVTTEFLEFSKRSGNDLSTPQPFYAFPGLVPGDQWCLVAARWQEAFDAGVAPPVVLEATHAGALEWVSLDDLRAHAV